MKLRLMKKRLLLLSKLNKYQKNFFELQVNSAMDKAISDELLIKSFLDRQKKKDQVQKMIKKRISED